MWFQVLPSLLIVTTCVTLPAYIAPALTKFFTGYSVFRTSDTEFEVAMYARDTYLFQDRYRTSGLNCLPDK